MKKVLFAGLFAATFSLVACNNGDKDDSKDVAENKNEQKFDSTNMEKDAEFAVDVAIGGMMEVKASELAATNASSAALKEFAGMMITDHNAANAELKTIATAQNISLPDSLTADKMDKYNDLASKKGADFDKAYAELMQDDHKSTIDKFEKEATDGKNAAVKAFATKTLPALKMHKEKIDAIKDAMK